MSSSDVILVWIFDRLALDVALAGDLREERARGRSMIWYCRQVLIAICIGIWRPIFHHKLLALRALATGCALDVIWLFLWLKFLHIGLPVRPEFSFASIGILLIILLSHVMMGWVVARTHRRYPVPMVLVFVIWDVLWYLGGTLDSFGKPEFIPSLVWYLAPESVAVVGLLFGASLVPAAKSTHQRPR